MNKKPFRFGVTAYGAESGAAWIAKARRVEEIGYSSLLVPDHFIGQFSPMPALAAAAAVTKRLRVGTIVCDNDFRHPVMLAKEAATIDFISDGRFELGIGAGWLKAEHDALGIGFDSPSVRVRRLTEAIAVIKGYFGKPVVKFSGEFYRVDGELGIEQTPPPVQRPHPPLLIGGGGRRMLELAAREADIVGIAAKTRPDGTGPDLEDAELPLQRKIDWIRESAGGRIEKMELHVQTWAAVVTDDRAQAAAELAENIPLPPSLMLTLPYLLAGTIEEIISSLHAYREQYGINYYSIFNRDMEGFAPIVARMAGR